MLGSIYGPWQVQVVKQKGHLVVSESQVKELIHEIDDERGSFKWLGSYDGTLYR